MKTITIDIADNVYSAFQKFLKTLPKNSFKLYAEDIDALTEDEKKEVDLLLSETDENNYKKFDEWDEISKDL